MRVETDEGPIFDLGVTETTPTISIVDYSRRVTDDFGVTTVVERGFARRMSVRFATPFDGVDLLQRRLASLRASPALWVADDRFASLSVTGFYKEFDIDLAMAPTSYCTLTVEGLAITEPLTDTGGDPAPDGQTSTLRLLQPADVTTSALVASSVAEADYPEWSSGVSYPVGARVIRATTHRVYENTAAANIANDPANSPNLWLDTGPTNRWAMFDQALGTATTATGSIGVTLDVGPAHAIALLDVVATSVRVQATGYDRTIAAGPGAVTFLDLPGTAGQIIVTITGTGAIEVGTLLIGNIVGLGITEASPSAGITDYSRKVVDDFGDVTVVQRAWSKRMSARALISTDALDNVVSRIAAVRARPSLWIGQAGLDSLTIYGFFKDFSIEVAENVSKLSLSIDGMSKAAKVEPLKLTVDWPEIGDPDGTKPDDNADVTGEHTSLDTAHVSGVPSSELVISLNDVINTSLDQAAAIMASQQLAEFRSVETDILTHYDGLKAEIVVKQAIQQHTDDTSAMYLIINTIGALTPDGSAFVIDGSKVYVDADHSMAAKFGEITANFGAADDKMTALVTNFANVYSSNSVTRAQAISNLQALFGPTAAAAVVTVQTAQAAINSSTASSITTLNTRTNNHSASITTFNEVLINPDGSAAAKAILAINVDGKVGGMYGTVTKTVANMRQVWDAFSLEQPDGTLLLYAAGGVVKMPAVVVDTLEANTVTTDNIIANNVSGLVSGSLASALHGSSYNDWQSVLSVPFTLARTAEIMVVVGGRHAYFDDLNVAWAMRCRLDAGGPVGPGAGGQAAATDCPALIAPLHTVPAGLHTVYIEWFGDDTSLQLLTCEAIVFYRYK